MGLLKDAYLKKVLSGEVVPDKKKLTDGEGLYVLVRQLKSGIGLYWQYNYRWQGRNKTTRIGAYPLISVTEARKQHREAKVELARGAVDPAAKKRAAKLSSSAANNFKTIALEWLEVKEGGQRHKDMVRRYFDNDIFPVLGGMSVVDIRPPDVVRLVKRVGSRGALDQARRVGRWVYKIFQYAMTIGRAESNPADIDLSLILPPHITKSHAAIIDPVLVGQLLRDIDQYHGYFVTRCLLQLAALLMVRPGNLVAMEWVEIDWVAKTWTIEARKLKNRQHIKQANREEDQHVVALPDQAILILRDLEAMEWDSPYVFPNQRGKNTHMVTDSIRAALRGMGYDKDVMSGHGFRAMARTMLEEQLGWDEKLAEMQLSHKVKSHGGAYDRTQHLAKRAEMMQAWADYLDRLRQG